MSVLNLEYDYEIMEEQEKAGLKNTAGTCLFIGAVILASLFAALFTMNTSIAFWAMAFAMVSAGILIGIAFTLRFLFNKRFL